jgi:hypothetical protein
MISSSLGREIKFFFSFLYPLEEKCSCLFYSLMYKVVLFNNRLESRTHKNTESSRNSSVRNLKNDDGYKTFLSKQKTNVF